MSEKKLSPIQAIFQKCLECSGGSRKELENCIVKDCPLYPFRNLGIRKRMEIKFLLEENLKKENVE